MGLATIPIIPSFDLSMICRGTATLGESMGALLSTKPGTVEVALGCLNSGQMWPNVAKCGQMWPNVEVNHKKWGFQGNISRFDPQQ